MRDYLEPLCKLYHIEDAPIFLIWLIVGQFDVIVFAKISFDGAVVMSDTASHLGTLYLRWNGAKISPSEVV